MSLTQPLKNHAIIYRRVSVCRCTGCCHRYRRYTGCIPARPAIPANTGKYRSYTGKYPFISVYTNETSKRRVHSNRIALYARCWRAEDALIPAIPGLYRHFFRDIPANFKLYQLSPAYTGKVCVIPAFISVIPVNTPRYSPKPFNGLILLSTRLVIPSLVSTIGLIAPADQAGKHKSGSA